MSLLASPAVDVETAELRPANRRVAAAPSRAEAIWAADGAVAGTAVTWRDGGDVRVAAVGDVLRIGRSLNADVRLEDVHTSRRHALIRRDGDTLTLCHEKSLNGLWLNGRPVTVQAPLRDDDVVLVGVTELRVVDL